MSWRVTGPGGKEIAKDAITIRAQLALGGDEFPAKFSFTTGHEMAAGEYVAVVELTDRLVAQGFGAAF
jgi:archaeosine-15-forming tRNA-guanine transglycosylase